MDGSAAGFWDSLHDNKKNMKSCHSTFVFSVHEFFERIFDLLFVLLYMRNQNVFLDCVFK